MSSALRPKDIQARIRAGESASSVAEVAQVPVERIMVYVLPVIAEREHIAALARSAAVRRRHAGVPSRLLGDAVAQRLTAVGVEPEQATWDAWRRDDGRWTVTVDPGSGRSPGTYLFDVSGRYAVAADDAGRELVGDVPPTAAADADEMAIATAVSDTPPENAPEEQTSTEPEAQPDRRTEDTDETEPAGTAEEALHPDAATIENAPAPGDADGQLVLDDVPDAGADSPPRKRRERKRPSVPSWDEIVFGGGGGKPDG